MTAPATVVVAPAALLSVRTWVGVWVTLAPLMLWSSVSITRLTYNAGVWAGICWIPALATDGAMVVATGLAVNHLLDPVIRRWAGVIAGVGIVGSIATAGAEHYLSARHITPPAELAAVIGGIPSLMGALLVHVLMMIGAQQRREQAELGTATEELACARTVRAATDREITETSQAHQRARQAELDAATRSRQAVHQELRQAEELGAALSQQRRANEAEAQAAEQARREAERLRSQQRRAQHQQNGPRPVSQHQQSGSRPVSREQRRAWVRQQIAAGDRPTGAQVDRRFGPPRTGAAIVREVDDELDAELRAVAQSPATTAPSSTGGHPAA